MQFNTLLQRKIKVRQKDGFYKYGTLNEETDDFIAITFKDGRLHYIQKDKIDTVEEDV